MTPDLDDITANERIFLLALALRAGQRATARELAEGNPVAFGNRNAQGVNGIAGQLTRKGLVTRLVPPDGLAPAYQLAPGVMSQLGVTAEPFTPRELDALALTAGELWDSTDRFDPDEVLNDYQRELLDRAAAEFRSNEGAGFDGH